MSFNLLSLKSVSILGYVPPLCFFASSLFIALFLPSSIPALLVAIPPLRLNIAP
jgi:hypothetical protein